MSEVTVSQKYKLIQMIINCFLVPDGTDASWTNVYVIHQSKTGCIQHSRQK